MLLWWLLLLHHMHLSDWSWGGIVWPPKHSSSLLLSCGCKVVLIVKDTYVSRGIFHLFGNIVQCKIISVVLSGFQFWLWNLLYWSSNYNYWWWLSCFWSNVLTLYEHWLFLRVMIIALVWIHDCPTILRACKAIFSAYALFATFILSSWKLFDSFLELLVLKVHLVLRVFEIVNFLN